MFKTYHESLQHLISQNLVPAYKDLAYEADWLRKTEIWQLEVADALFANLGSLKKIYQSQVNKTKEKVFSLTLAK